jgi:hypothetical protein
MSSRVVTRWLMTCPNSLTIAAQQNRIDSRQVAKTQSSESALNLALCVFAREFRLHLRLYRISLFVVITVSSLGCGFGSSRLPPHDRPRSGFD